MQRVKNNKRIVKRCKNILGNVAMSTDSPGYLSWAIGVGGNVWYRIPSEGCLHWSLSTVSDF